MFIELIDILRCTASHDDIPLVAAVFERRDRDITTGLLGCPDCGSQYAIENGIAVFGAGRALAPPGTHDPYAEPEDDAAMRCAAMLNLFDGGGTAVLAGAWTRSASALHEMTRTSLLLIDPPAGTPLGGGVSGIRIGDVLPIASGSLRGAALDEPWSTAPLIASAARALKPGGRLVAQARAALPPGIVERARDGAHWVGEAEAGVSAPVQLKGRFRQA